MQFDGKMSLGNMITVGTVLVGLVVGWTQFGTGIEANSAGIAKVETRVTAIENNFNGLLRELGQERVKQTEVLTTLQTDLKYLREAVDKLGQ